MQSYYLKSKLILLILLLALLQTCTCDSNSTAIKNNGTETLIVEVKMPPEVHFNFLNKEMLCTLCLKIMEKYKTSYAAKGQDFIEKLKASCKGFSNKHEIRRCENGFTDEAIDILIKNNAHEICEIARFCKANEQPLEKDNEDNIDAFSNVAAIPEVQKDAAIKD